MTPVEMQFAFEVKLKSIFKDNNIKLFTSDIEIYLNFGDNDVLNKYYQSFDINLESRRALQKLIKQHTFLPLDIINKVSYPQNSIYFNLPVDVKYVVSEWVTIKDVLENLKQIRVYPTSYKNVQLNYENPFRMPDDTICWRVETFDTANQLQLIYAPDRTVDKYEITYIKVPNKISIATNTPSEIDEAFHYEIVDRAVAEAAKDLGKELQLKSINKKLD